MGLGKVIRAARNQLGLTQKELAQKLRSDNMSQIGVILPMKCV